MDIISSKEEYRRTNQSFRKPCINGLNGPLWKTYIVNICSCELYAYVCVNNAIIQISRLLQYKTLTKFNSHFSQCELAIKV